MGIFKRNINKNSEIVDLSKKQIYNMKVNRDSVCMGDDCDDHLKKMNIDENLMLSEFLLMLADYVPHMKNVIWAIRSNIGLCGYIITDNEAMASVKLSETDRALKDTNICEIMCKYYYPSIFSWIDGKSGKRIDKYAECTSFFEKVKKDNELQNK